MPPWSRPRWADEPTMLTLGTVVEALTGQAYPFLDQGVTVGAIDSPPVVPVFLFRRPSPPAALQSSAGHWRAKLNLRVIGITGSVGKSSSKELAAEVLEGRYRTLRNPGNLNNEIGLPLSMLRLTEMHQRG